MNFQQGQRVRIKGKQLVGMVERKLISLDDVYAVAIENASPNEEKLVRGADLEIVATLEILKSA